jgi:hypothetical protein
MRPQPNDEGRRQIGLELVDVLNDRRRREGSPARARTLIAVRFAEIADISRVQGSTGRSTLWYVRITIA